MTKYLLYGSGGHAKVVLECLLSEKKQAIGFFDDAPKQPEFEKVIVLGSYNEILHPNAEIIITVGNNKMRKTISAKIRHRYGISCHTSSLISPSALIGEGSVALHGTVVQANAMIAKHVIVNTKSVVEHDCVVEDFVHLAPGAVICGQAKIGEGTLIGANAVVAPNVQIGKWCQVSAGSSVLENVPDFSLVMGVPGKIVKILDSSSY